MRLRSDSSDGWQRRRRARLLARSVRPAACRSSSSAIPVVRRFYCNVATAAETAHAEVTRARRVPGVRGPDRSVRGGSAPALAGLVGVRRPGCRVGAADGGALPSACLAGRGPSDVFVRRQIFSYWIESHPPTKLAVNRPWTPLPTPPTLSQTGRRGSSADSRSLRVGPGHARAPARGRGGGGGRFLEIAARSTSRGAWRRGNSDGRREGVRVMADIEWFPGIDWVMDDYASGLF